MKTRFVIVLVALASLAVIAPAQGVKKPAPKKPAVKKSAPVAKKVVVVAKKPVAKKPVSAPKAKKKS